MRELSHRLAAAPLPISARLLAVLRVLREHLAAQLLVRVVAQPPAHPLRTRGRARQRVRRCHRRRGALTCCTRAPGLHASLAGCARVCDRRLRSRRARTGRTCVGAGGRLAVAAGAAAAAARIPGAVQADGVCGGGAAARRPAATAAAAARLAFAAAVLSESTAVLALLGPLPGPALGLRTLAGATFAHAASSDAAAAAASARAAATAAAHGLGGQISAGSGGAAAAAAALVAADVSGRLCRCANRPTGGSGPRRLPCTGCAGKGGGGGLTGSAAPARAGPARNQGRPVSQPAGKPTEAGASALPPPAARLPLACRSAVDTQP